MGLHAKNKNSDHTLSTNIIYKKTRKVPAVRSNNEEYYSSVDTTSLSPEQRLAHGLILTIGQDLKSFTFSWDFVAVN